MIRRNEIAPLTLPLCLGRLFIAHHYIEARVPSRPDTGGNLYPGENAAHSPARDYQNQTKANAPENPAAKTSNDNARRFISNSPISAQRGCEACPPHSQAQSDKPDTRHDLNDGIPAARRGA